MSELKRTTETGGFWWLGERQKRISLYGHMVDVVSEGRLVHDHANEDIHDGGFEDPRGDWQKGVEAFDHLRERLDDADSSLRHCINSYETPEPGDGREDPAFRRGLLEDASFVLAELAKLRTYVDECEVRYREENPEEAAADVGE